MITCSNCGHSNQDHFNFCEKCGNNLKNVSSTENKVPEKQVSENQTSENNIPQERTTQNNASSSAPSYLPEGPKKKKKSVKKIILAVAAVFILYILMSNIILAFSPATRLLKGINDFGKFSKFTSEVSLTLDYKGSDKTLDLLDNIGVAGTISTDMEKLLVESSVKLLYNKKKVTELKAGINDKLVWIDPLDLHKDKFYYEFDNKTAVASSKEIDIYRNAFRKISLDFNEKEYLKIVKDVFGKDLKNSLGKVTITLDGNTIAELLDEFLEYAKEDKKLMKSVRTEGIKFIKNIMKHGEKGQLSTLYDRDSFEIALEFFEDKEGFEDSFSFVIESLQYQLNNILYYFDNLMPEINITLHYGLFNKLNKVTANFTVSAADNYTNEKLVLEYNIITKEGAKFTNFNTKKAKNLEKVMDDPAEIMDIGKTIATNLIESITDNKEFRKEIKEIEDRLGMDIEDLTDYLEYSMPFYGW
mgnify:CR=1 FL=1